MSDKIKPHHLGRKAILYVRQSSPHQVMHNQESRLLQYAMRDRLRALGWREIEVVDDDLGRSAAGSAIRAGFERMVVCTENLVRIELAMESRHAWGDDRPDLPGALNLLARIMQRRLADVAQIADLA